MPVGPELEQLLSPEGPVARRLPRYERRPQQEVLAREIGRAIREKHHLLAEAGTGVGKSFAYLLPAILKAVETAKGPVVVSTRTIALQEQLERKDLPFLASVLPLEWSSVVAMGRNNYLCLRRMHRAMADRRTLFPDIETMDQLQRIAGWSMTTKEGTRSDLPFQPVPVVWEEVQAEHGNCLHQRCPHFNVCHYQRGRRRMGTAQILVVNHSLYFADLALRRMGAQYLPEHEVVVFDEAHHLERIATEAFSLSIAPATVEWHLRRLLSRDAQRGLLLGIPAAVPALEKLELVRSRAEGFFARLEERLAARGAAESTAGLASTDVVSDELSAPLAALSAEVLSAAESIDDVDRRMELRARAGSVARLGLGIAALSGKTDPGIVRWVERERRQPCLKGAPLSVHEELGKHLFSRVPTCVLVSATLGAPDDAGFAWLRGRLGVAGGAAALRLGSPFPYEDRVLLRIEDDMPDPAGASDAFERESIERIRAHCIKNQGRALVLCTSWRFVERCHAEIAGDLEAAGIACMKQGELALSRLVERKRDEPATVLIGADSLWEGIDLPGPNLDLVIICRLPFPVPSHPLTAARMQAIEARGGSSFKELSLPEAILRFRQGFGRLIRSMEDSGRVVVLDPRIRTKRYGALFIESLPRCRVEWASGEP